MSDFDSYDYDAGEVAFLAYFEILGKNGFDIVQPNEFRDLAKIYQDAWTAAAKAVKKRYGAIY